MCIVEHVEMESVFTLQPKKRLVCTTKKWKPCCHVSNFPFKDKNRQICCLAVMVHIVLQETRVATTKKKNHLHF